MKAAPFALALPRPTGRHELHCDTNTCRKPIPPGEAKLITRDRNETLRRFCGGECFAEWSAENRTRFGCG